MIKRKMTAIEIMVYNQIPKGYLNPNQPRKIRDIKLSTGFSDREIKDTIRDLNTIHGKCIVGLRRPPYGYFEAQTLAELNMGLAPYKRQVITEQENIKVLMENAEREELA